MTSLENLISFAYSTGDEKEMLFIRALSGQVGES